MWVRNDAGVTAGAGLTCGHDLSKTDCECGALRGYVWKGNVEEGLVGCVGWERPVSSTIRYLRSPRPSSCLPIECRYLNLNAPSGSSLEEFARLTEAELRCQRALTGDQMAGRDGFGQLLGACLDKLSGSQAVTVEQRRALERAGVVQEGCAPHWRGAAAREARRLREV